MDIKIFYGVIGLIYIILAGVDLPTKIDDFIRNNHSFAYIIIGTLHLIMMLEEWKEMKFNPYFWIFLAYCWYKLLSNTSKRTFRSFKVL